MPRIHRPRSTPERIGRFRGKFAFLSNFHRHPFDVDRDVDLVEPLDAVLNALAAHSNATETAP